MADYLGIAQKTFLVFGVANKRSVAWHIARSLEEQGARVIYSVRSESRKKSLETLLAGKTVYICDVEHEGSISKLASEVRASNCGKLDGIVHSIAFANYSTGMKPFHETLKADFLQASAISAFSIISFTTPTPSEVGSSSPSSSR